MTPLREKFITEMQLRNFSERTIYSYVSNVMRLSRFFNKSPANITRNEIRSYLLYLTNKKKMAPATVRLAYHSISSFYFIVLHRKNFLSDIPAPRKPNKKPNILDCGEIEKILNAANNLKHKTLLITIYSGGLRVSEALNLQVSDIDSKRMQIKIRSGKGDKDRYTVLSENNLLFLREYYRKYCPQEFLFFGRNNRSQPMTRMFVWTFLQRLCKKAGIQKRVSAHTLRHSFATHMLESGVDIYQIQVLLGHSSIRSTSQYLHVKKQDLLGLKTPFDRMGYVP